MIGIRSSPFWRSLTAAPAAPIAAARPRYHLDANGAFFPEVMKRIEGATKSIDIAQYNLFSESGDVKRLVDALIAKKKANPALQIRVFLEADHGAAAARNLATAKKLEAAGITVVRDSPEIVTHAKAIVVDARYVLAGSHNLTNTSLGKNNETSLAFDSPALARAYATYFDQLLSAPDQLHASTTRVGNVTLLTDGDAFGALLSTIRSAKTSIDASMYSFNFSPKDPRAKQVAQALVEATNRGVHVRLFLEQSDADFAPEITRANRRAALWLAAHGIDDVHFDSPRQISHQKFLVADGAQVVLGSSNWSTADFDERHQVNWKLDDPRLGARLCALLQRELA